MKTIPFGKSGLQVPAIALGCMRLTALDEQGAQRYVRTALDLGANFFDHADIYGGGACEARPSRASRATSSSSRASAASCPASATISPRNTS